MRSIAGIIGSLKCDGMRTVGKVYLSNGKLTVFESCGNNIAVDLSDNGACVKTCSVGLCCVLSNSYAQLNAV